MEPVVTPAEMAQADRRTIAAGTPEQTLIDRAGRAVAWHVRRLLGGVYGRRAVVVCGKGNNGADGHVAARVLSSWGMGVDVFDLAPGIDRVTLRRALDRCDVAIDAMYGTGFHGVLDDTALLVDGELYRAPLIVAVDIPSGVDGATGAIGGEGFIGGAVLAHETVCFAALKPGLLFEPGRFHAGRVTVVDIGIDVAGSAVGLWTARDAAGAPLERWPHEHKWSSSLLVVAGSHGMTGAALLVARAAQRAGAGMVVAALPGSVAAARASGSEIVTRSLPETVKGLLASEAGATVVRDAERFKALVLGPGLGRGAETDDAIAVIVAGARVPMVLDADGLNALGQDRAPLRARQAAQLPPVVLTPHAGEYERLMGRSVGADRVEATLDLARDTGCVALLKGPGTVIASPAGQVAIVANGGPELATAGTGDVLAGVIGAFLAHLGDDLGIEAVFDAAAHGAWVHAEAGRSQGNASSTIASDVIEAIPNTLAALRRGEDR